MINYFPYFVIIIFALVGGYLFGFKGLFVGAGLGYFFNLVIGGLNFFVKANPYKIKEVTPLVKSFITLNKDKFANIERLTGMDESSLINLFIKYIAEIHQSAIKLKDPDKKTANDLEYAYYRANFVAGGLEWKNSFSNIDERELMAEFVLFCEKWLYDGFR